MKHLFVSRFEINDVAKHILYYHFKFCSNHVFLNAEISKNYLVEMLKAKEITYDQCQNFGICI
jgi:hypothetical protein